MDPPCQSSAFSLVTLSRYNRGNIKALEKIICQSFVADANAESVKAEVGFNGTEWEAPGSGVFETLTR